MAPVRTRKRKRPEDDVSLDDLNQDLIERVLSRLPPSSFFRLRSVCKRWSSAAISATFRIACSQIRRREPWLLMVGSDLRQSIVYDTGEGRWKNLGRSSVSVNADDDPNPIPVASSGGLVCYRTVSANLIVCNPLTGDCRRLPPVDECCTVHAIAMRCACSSNGGGGGCSSYRVVMVSGEYPNLGVKVYDSDRGVWEDVVLSRRQSSNSEIAGDESVYFLSKAGDVVASNMQRSPWKQYSSVVSTEDGGGEVIHFLSPSGAVVACSLTQRTFVEHPRLMPMYLEHSLDVAECDGEMLVVVLSDFLESASLRVWRFSGRTWHQIACMPPAMSHEFYGKKADVNCVGFRHTIFVCVTADEFNACFACNLTDNEWIELGECWVGGRARHFVSAFSFEPRIEACV